MEVLFLISHLGDAEELPKYISKAPGISEVYITPHGVVVAKADVSSSSELKRLIKHVRRCRGVLRVEYLIARRRLSANTSC